MGNVEVWENQTRGLVSIPAWNEHGHQTTVIIEGQGKAFVREADRERLTALIPENPFTNGILQRQGESGPSLPAVFKLRGSKFQAEIDAMPEFQVRELAEIAEEAGATAAQVRMLKETIKARFVREDVMPSYEDLVGDPA